MLEAALVVGAILSVGAGYLLHRWRFLPALAAVGIIVIVVHVSTRDLSSGGHDDRRLVAFAELALLLGLLVLFATGILFRRWYDRHSGSGPGRVAG
jgi:hypothetical protein